MSGAKFGPRGEPLNDEAKAEVAAIAHDKGAGLAGKNVTRRAGVKPAVVGLTGTADESTGNRPSDGKKTHWPYPSLR